MLGFRPRLRQMPRSGFRRIGSRIADAGLYVPLYRPVVPYGSDRTCAA